MRTATTAAIQQHHAQHPRRRPHQRLRLKLLLPLLLLVATVVCSVYAWNQSYVSQWSEAPLDHLTSTAWKPLYHAMGCPNMQETVTVSRNIPFYMISARPKHQVGPVLASYADHFNVTLYNTTELSRQFQNPCPHGNSFKSRLFGIYQTFLSDVMAEYVVTVEDDVMLLDGVQFQRELDIAISRQYEYYSFTKNSHNTCLYQFGTTAQLFRRNLIERLVNVDHDIICRLPIDMYIAQQGPWYVTQHQLVQHVGTKRLTHIGGG